MARIMRLNKKRLRNNTTIFTLAPSVFLSLLSSLLCGCDGRLKLVKKHHLHTFQLSVQTRTGPALILPVKGEADFQLAYAQYNCHSAAAAETLVGEFGGTEEQRPEFLSAQLLPMVVAALELLTRRYIFTTRSHGAGEKSQQCYIFATLMTPI